MRRYSLGIALVGIVFMAGCSMFGPKPEVVYHKPKVKSTAAKIVVMPVTDFSGEKSATAEDVEKSVNVGWTKVLGTDKMLPAGAVIEKINEEMGDGYDKIIATIKKPSKVAKLKTDPMLVDYIKKISEATGDYNLAFTVIDGDKDSFDDGTSIYLYLGLFDTKAFTWKWITKTETKKSMFSGWDASSVSLVSNSFDKAAEVDVSKTNMARRPAGK